MNPCEPDVRGRQTRLRAGLLATLVLTLATPAAMVWWLERSAVLPPPCYSDCGDGEYFAPGPEFKLSREAAPDGMSGQGQPTTSLEQPWYQSEGVQYFPPGPEFKLSREAAAQAAFKEEHDEEVRR